MKWLRLRETGDTLIEVLIALTVVASMIGAAYATSSRNLRGNRQAQERGEALKLAESQLEKLKGMVAAGQTSPFTTTGSFCMSQSGAVQQATTANCTTSAGGPSYYVTIERQTNDNFAIVVVWDRVGGNGSDVINMNYRVHPASTTFGTVTPDPPVTPPPAATGSLTCNTTGTTTISLSYSFANSSNPTLYRGSTALTGVSSSPGTYNDSGLTPNTGYVYYLRNGNSPTATAIGTASCTTQSNATGSISCSYVSGAGVVVSYSWANASSPSIWRGGTYMYNASGSSSASFTDNDPAITGSEQDVTYTLRNGQSASSTALASGTCHVPAPPLPGPICIKSC
jgi:type II secretory pathway pseudopilin PulG